MNERIYISNQDKLEKTKKAIQNGGKDKLHVVSDHDRTLTKTIVNGKWVNSLIAILRDENYLTPDYPKKAQELYNKYSPIENDLRISEQERAKAMHQWWMEHFKLLIESGLTKDDIAKAVASSQVQLRHGCSDFLKNLYKHGIPLIIFSACGLGGDAISIHLKKQEMLFPNIHIVSNSYVFDDQNRAIDINKPIVHCMNKNKTILKDIPAINELVSGRKNVLLLGDSPSDIDMITGFEYENLIKIGFLNKDVEEKLEKYKNLYDVVLTNDSSMDFVNQLLTKLITK